MLHAIILLVLAGAPGPQQQGQAPLNPPMVVVPSPAPTTPGDGAWPWPTIIGSTIAAVGVVAAAGIRARYSNRKV